MSKIEVNQISSQCGSTLTIGQSGDSIQLACGATQTGFGRTGTVDWDTTPKTATFSAVSGNGYFCNTTSSAFTVNLPAGSAGAIVSLADYAATWQTNALTVSPNGTDKIGSVNADVSLSTEGQSVTFVYVDSTQGWINTMDSTSNVRANAFVEATGGTETTCGDFKIHTFTGPGTFTVTSEGAPTGSNTVDYLVVAGGGSGGGYYTGGGGGAGGYRESSGAASGCYTASPLGACVSALPVTVQGYPITVGGGGSPIPGTCNPEADGNSGSNSIFSTITSAGGGGGAGGSVAPGVSGGSGGGGTRGCTSGGSGNTPPVSPPQGNNGGSGSPDSGNPAAGGGGGGAGAAGSTGVPSCGGNGGNGVTSSINATPTTRAGGGGGATFTGTGGTGGTGGGGRGANETPSSCAAVAGTTNTGGGGGGLANGPSGAGGSGIVIIRYKYQ